MIDTADRLAIHELLADYGNLIDERQFSRTHELLTADARYVLVGFGRPSTASSSATPPSPTSGVTRPSILSPITSPTFASPPTAPSESIPKSSASATRAG